MKYYFVDVGLRNARLNFRQQEENHIMENIIFNELKIRGYDVDVGVVEHNIKNARVRVSVIIWRLILLLIWAVNAFISSLH